MTIKLERDKYHSRTLALTGNDTLDEIAITYTGESTAHKGVAFDSEVIPAIITAVNSHAALLEALEQLVNRCETEPLTTAMQEAGQGGMLPTLTAEARAAIKLAKESA